MKTVDRYAQGWAVLFDADAKHLAYSAAQFQGRHILEIFGAFEQLIDARLFVLEQLREVSE